MVPIANACSHISICCFEKAELRNHVDKEGDGKEVLVQNYAKKQENIVESALFFVDW
jgi:hypothetical protein